MIKSNFIIKKSLSCYNNKEIQKNFITNATYLCDSFTTIDGIKIYGMPWTENIGIEVSR
jgi:hypothetical protein